jgi:phosphatidylglycerophosphatase A
LEALHGGWGIVLDDVAAGIMGNLLLHAGLALM